MYCTNCGKELDEDAVFCIKCGNRIKPEEPAIIDNEANDIENNIEEQQKGAGAVNKRTPQIEQDAFSVESQINEEKSIEEEEQDVTEKQKRQSVALQKNNEILDNDGFSNNLTESEAISLSILKKQKKKFRLFFALSIIFFISTIGTAILAYRYYKNWLDSQSEYDVLSKSYDRISQHNTSLEYDKRHLEDDYNALLGSDVFVIITRIYNSADNSTYLDHSKITYLAFDYTVAKSKDVKNSSPLYIKVFEPDGTLLRGESSPDYSFEKTLNSNYFDWGWKTPSYSTGHHFIEFWYNGRCVGRKKFYIY